jgi:hypothetical protein
MPISASFFFEREAARLMSVRHRWPQGLRWWLFCQFPREDTADDYERRHDCPESPNLHLMHGGVLRHSTPLVAGIITRGDYQVLRSNHAAGQCSQRFVARRTIFCVRVRRRRYLISGTTFGGARFILGAVASNLTHPLQSRGHGRH